MLRALSTSSVALANDINSVPDRDWYSAIESSDTSAGRSCSTRWLQGDAAGRVLQHGAASRQLPYASSSLAAQLADA